MNISSIVVPLIFFAVILSLGCGNYVKVRGTVVYEDGTPLPKGVIILQNDGHQAKGMIRPDGCFTIGSFKTDDGVPRGVYDVSFTGTHIETLSGGEVPPGQDPMTVPGPEIVLEQFLDEKYSNRKTSGIIYDTKDGPVLNITVEKPKT